MTPRFDHRIVGAVVAFAAVGGACSTTDDVGGVRDLADDGPVISTEFSIPEITIAIPDFTLPDVSDDTTVESGTVYDFTSPTGDYTVEFPAEPTRFDTPIDVAGETLSAAFFAYDDVSSAYLSTTFDYPQGVTDPDDDIVLLGARDGMVASSGGQLQTSDLVEQDGVRGVTFTFTVATGAVDGVGSAVMYFDRPRLYQTYALGDTADAARFQRFVESFEFTGAGS